MILTPLRFLWNLILRRHYWHDVRYHQTTPYPGFRLLSGSWQRVAWRKAWWAYAKGAWRDAVDGIWRPLRRRRRRVVSMMRDRGARRTDIGQEEVGEEKEGGKE